MSTTRVRGLGIAFAVGLLVVGGVRPMSGDAPRERADEPTGDRVKDLLKERLAVLREVANLTAQDYQTGKASFDRLHHARMAVVSARLELCDTDRERVGILEEGVALARDNEKTAAALYQAGKAPASDPLLAKAGRLEAEIALEKTRVKTPREAEVRQRCGTR